MKKKLFFIALLLLVTNTLFAQVSINSDGSAPNPSAMLDVKSTTKGTLLSRMTSAEISAIPSPANGLQVFCTTDSKMYIYYAPGGQWKELAYGSGTINSLFSCGNSFTINHIAGSVAPVNKTVTYEMVTNIPGEPSKCWITSNLGADHQATAVDDGTEASAGWYWQFNLKQGYKHDGNTRTPNTPWINSISENSAWTSNNDPCTIELATGWHIPTYTEWYNVDNIGGWTNWNDLWNSGLKLHAAGCLDGSDGSLANRDSNGYYWSSTQLNAPNGWSLNFSNSSSYMGNFWFKTNGFAVRCVRDY
jgi:hypothetical protein